MMGLSPEEWHAIILSVKVGGWAVVVGLPPAVFMAWLLARVQFPGKVLVNTLVHLPLVVPPVVTGYLLILLMGRRSLLGGWFEAVGLHFAFNWKGAVLASLIMSFPLMVRAVRLSIDSIDPGLEEAARTLGSSRLRTFLTITLPLSLPGLISAAMFGFARSLGEFGATITFVSNIPRETQTLPLALYTQTQIPGGEPMALRLCLISIGIAFVALIASELITQKSQRRLRS